MINERYSLRNSVDKVDKSIFKSKDLPLLNKTIDFLNDYNSIILVPDNLLEDYSYAKKSYDGINLLVISDELDKMKEEFLKMNYRGSNLENSKDLSDFIRNMSFVKGLFVDESKNFDVQLYDFKNETRINLYFIPN